MVMNKAFLKLASPKLLMLPLAASLSLSVLPAQAAEVKSNSFIIAQRWGGQRWGNRPSRLDQLERLSYHMAQFRKSYDRALDRSRLDGSDREDRLNDRVGYFHNAIRNVRDNFADRDGDREQIRALIDRGRRLDEFLERSPRKRAWLDEWRVVRRDLAALESWGRRRWRWY
jgi:hypothetical protein